MTAGSKTGLSLLLLIIGCLQIEAEIGIASLDEFDESASSTESAARFLAGWLAGWLPSWLQNVS